MGAKLSFRRVLATGLVVGSMSVGLMAVTASGAATQPKASGTLTFAEGPGAAPNYIFPYMGCQYFSVANINQFEELMTRPLYWFGLGASSAVQYPLSLAAAPNEAANHRTITIDLKGWKYSDGQKVDAESVAFFLNLYKADPASYCGYNAGYGIPDKLASITYPGGLTGSTVVLHFSVPVNPYWILYNYLSEITPMPNAWDKTSTSAAAGSGDCANVAYGSGAATTNCKAVEAFLDAQSGNTSTYTDAMWQTVDGPFKLSSFDALGNATFVPNGAYSGPQKALLAQVKEKAYTTVTSEENDLYANAIQLGYVDPNILPNSAPAPGKVGNNVASLKAHYTLTTGSPWSFNYAPFNLAASDPKHAALNQLYIRQALQGAVNQLAIIKAVDKGYGWPTCSPLPPNTPASISGKVNCAYPYSATKWKALLTSHGWKIEGGVQTCTKPGTSTKECGAGISNGYKLNFNMIWASGSPALNTTVATEFSEWNAIGVKFTGEQSSFDNVIAECNGGTYQICWWGGGWIYAPDYYPSGETLFTLTGSFDVGSYSNPTMTALIDQTTSGTAKLTDYAKFAAQQVPVLYEPNPTATAEIAKTVKCVNTKDCVPDPLQNFMPEYMHY
jgi:peptide/nickel transport system substrate-binding protein